MLTACWQAERQAPAVTVLTSDLWQEQDAPARDLVVLGPVRDGKLRNVLRSLDPSSAAILCVPADSKEFGQLRATYPRLVHVPLREDWAQTLLLVAGESLRRVEAMRDRKSTRLNSSHGYISYAVFCLKKKKNNKNIKTWNK